MSTKPMSPVQIENVPAKTKPDVQLVMKLIEKSEQGKLVWTRHTDYYAAETPDGSLFADLQVNGTNPFESNWSEFSVKINGEEILKVTNDTSPFAVLIGMSRSALNSAIGSLLSYLENPKRAQVKRGIEILDGL
jgi:hypothetical protein